MGVVRSEQISAKSMGKIQLDLFQRVSFAFFLFLPFLSFSSCPSTAVSQEGTVGLVVFSFHSLSPHCTDPGLLQRES